MAYAEKNRLKQWFARLWRTRDSAAPDMPALPSPEQAQHLLQANLLLNQINPHFLYNTLESIRGQAVSDGNEQVADMIEALSSFFRYNVSLKSGIVTLAEELHNVDEYLKIQSFRFGDRFRVHTLVDESLNVHALCLPKLTLQPIVENAIVHGLESREAPGVITIRVSDLDHLMLLHVDDDGVGMNETELETLLETLRRASETVPQGNHGGIALNNINQRIKLFFGDAYGLSVYSTQNAGTTVELLIPKADKDAHLMGDEPL